MEFSELVEGRRSVRAYKEGVVTEEEIEKIVLCAQNAPSWKNSQTARYYVAHSAEAIEAVRACLPEYNRNNTRSVGAYIVTAFVSRRSGFERDGSPTNELGDGWGAYDLGLSNMLLLLKAKESGLDTLVMGLRDEAGLRRFFGVPENEKIVSVIALGKGALSPEKPPRRKMQEILKIR